MATEGRRCDEIEATMAGPRPPGNTPDWYPDPLRPDRHRWFDGSQWTNAVLDQVPRSAADAAPGGRGFPRPGRFDAPSRLNASSGSAGEAALAPLNASDAQALQQPTAITERPLPLDRPPGFQPDAVPPPTEQKGWPFDDRETSLVPAPGPSDDSDSLASRTVGADPEVSLPPSDQPNSSLPGTPLPSPASSPDMVAGQVGRWVGGKN